VLASIVGCPSLIGALIAAPAPSMIPSDVWWVGPDEHPKK
jgi:hypothetical protein